MVVWFINTREKRGRAGIEEQETTHAYEPWSDQANVLMSKFIVQYCCPFSVLKVHFWSSKWPSTPSAIPLTSWCHSGVLKSKTEDQQKKQRAWGTE
jgi:hypothetical protein